MPGHDSDDDARRGFVIKDPAESPADGAEFRFDWVHFPPMAQKAAGAILQWDVFGSALLAMIFTEGDRRWADGSGVLIGPGLAFAARHVFESILHRLQAAELTVNAISLMPDGLMIWRVHQIIMGDTDVAILRLNLASAPPKDSFDFATITTRSPSVGEPVMIVGARGGEATPRDRPLGLDVRIGVGEIAEVYAGGRDKVILPHPAIAVSCQTLGGMSGGPAFDQNGNVLGILTSSIEDEDGPSNLSLWWPTVSMKIETFWLQGVVDLQRPSLNFKAGV